MESLTGVDWARRGLAAEAASEGNNRSCREAVGNVSRSRDVPCAPWHADVRLAGVDTQLTIALVLVGLAAVAAGSVGVLLPPGERIAAALPLVVGAGVGLVTLAVGANGAETDAEVEAVFLTGAALGFVATCATLALLWFRTRRHGAARAGSD